MGCAVDPESTELQAPIDFMMKGKLAGDQDIGLATIPGYSIRVVLLRCL